MRYTIISVGYDGGPKFATLAEAKKELAMWKQDALSTCKRRFRMGTAKTTYDGLGYQITCGINLYSAARIVEI